MIIYKDMNLIIEETGQTYDFIATIENRTDKLQTIVFYNNEMNDGFEIRPRDWVGLLNDENGRFCLEAIKRGDFGLL